MVVNTVVEENIVEEVEIETSNIVEKEKKEKIIDHQENQENSENQGNQESQEKIEVEEVAEDNSTVNPELVDQCTVLLNSSPQSNY